MKKNYCILSNDCTAFCHIAWCPCSTQTKKYEEELEKYYKLPFFKKLFTCKPVSPFETWF